MSVCQVGLPSDPREWLLLRIIVRLAYRSAVREDRAEEQLRRFLFTEAVSSEFES